MKRSTRRVGRSVIAAGLVLAVSACGGGDDSNLSEQAKKGREISNSNGCASCHGSDGQGGVGPTWQGIADTEVELDDGTVVVRDDGYLLRSILDPAVEIVPGYQVNMPTNGLNEEQARDIIAYIRELDAPE